MTRTVPMDSEELSTVFAELDRIAIKLAEQEFSLEDLISAGCVGTLKREADRQQLTLRAIIAQYRIH